MPRGWVTIASAAEILGVSVATLRNWDKTGKLPAEHQGSNRYRLYRISVLEQFAEKEGRNRKKPPLKLSEQEKNSAPGKKPKK